MPRPVPAMLTSRRDYILRIIEEVGRLLARVVSKRRTGADEEALQVVVQGCERLFGVESDRLFQFTPEQHFAMLTVDEPGELGRDKVLLYAALNAEAGRIYTKLGNRPMARATFLNALRFTLRARAAFSSAALPHYTPDIAELRAALGDDPLDAETIELLNAHSSLAQE